jgi:transportin-1
MSPFNARSPRCVCARRRRWAHGTDGAAQKLSAFTRVPDYIAYLAYILAHMPDQPERIRSIAAYLLKNNARSILSSTTPEAAQFVKAAVLTSFSDPTPGVRAAASQCIVTLMSILEPRNWPEALQLLVAQLDDQSVERQEVLSVSPAR